MVLSFSRDKTRIIYRKFPDFTRAAEHGNRIVPTRGGCGKAVWRQNGAVLCYTSAGDRQALRQARKAKGDPA